MDIFQVQEGKNNNVMFSAPHVYNHARLGVDKRMKQGEPYTDEIVKEVARRAESFAISTIIESLEFDPNFNVEKSNPYKAEIRKIVKSQKIKSLIDIHGLSDSHSYDFGIYFKPRFLKSRQMAFGIAEILNKGKLRGSLFQVLYFRPDGQETISEFCCEKLKIPAVQIEVARYIREDDILRGEFVARLEEFVMQMK